MTTMDGLLEQVLRSPRLLDWSDSINRTLKAEQTERTRFRSTLSDRREEFINGEVVEQVANQDQHVVTLDYLSTLITTYVRLRGLGSVKREQSLTAFPRNDYLPDLCFWPKEQGIGDDPNQSIYPPPAFVIEVLSPTTEFRDRGVKFEDYEAHGVQEYWIVDPARRTIEQYLKRENRFQLSFNGVDGTIKSEAIEGFEMPANVAFDDLVQMNTLQQLLMR